MNNDNSRTYELNEVKWYEWIWWVPFAVLMFPLLVGTLAFLVATGRYKFA